MVDDYEKINMKIRFLFCYVNLNLIRETSQIVLFRVGDLSGAFGSCKNSIHRYEAMRSKSERRDCRHVKRRRSLGVWLVDSFKNPRLEHDSTFMAPR